MISNLKLNERSSSFTLTVDGKNYDFKTKIVTKQGVSDVVASISALYLTGYDINELSLVLPFINPLKGEMEIISTCDEYNIYIDSANNFQAIKENIEFAKKVIKVNKRLICLLGIRNGFDKQTLKEIGEYVSINCDKIILTELSTYSGNINSVLLDGSKYFDEYKTLIIEDRKFAIESAIDLLNHEDILLILGKGKDSFIIRSLGKEAYEGDYNIAKNYFQLLKNAID